MGLLVDKNDVYNYYNIDLEVRLRVKGQPNNTTVVASWLEERHNEIYNFIARYAYYGYSQVERYLADAEARETIKKAVLHQCQYVAKNGDIGEVANVLLSGNRGVTEIDRRKQAESLISLKAEQELRAAGLLYAGAGR